MLPRDTRAAIASLLLLGPLSAAPLDHTPSAAERSALEQLRGTLSGRIVWESNRTGQWELYAMNADGTDARQITHLAKTGDSRAYSEYLRPRFSPDGRTILFGYGKARAPCEVWIMPADDGTPRKLTVGNPLNWASDNRRIYFVRDSLVRVIDAETGRESVVNQTRVPTDGRSGGMVGTLAPDLKSAVFRTSKQNEYFVFDPPKTVKTMGGCEPRITPDGRHLYWVLGPKNFQAWEIGTKREHQLLGVPPVKPFNYTYFPTVSADARWLLYAASPGDHSHSTSDYEVYLLRLKDWRPVGEPVRLTFNKRTDRWPFLWLDPGKAPPRAAPAVVDVDGDVPIFMFASEDATPEFGGDWGLWPQGDGCRGDATFLPDADADGGPGGAMRIDYVIREQPQSFSLWITSGDRPADLSGLDRFTIRAKGSVPSFTLVVKDRNATDPDAPDGIADCLVTGVTDEWQTLEMPFTTFRPRKRGTRVDWGSIHHLGISMIAPANAPAGRLFADNIRARRGAEEPRPPPPADDVDGRVVDGLLALVRFSEGAGNRLAATAGAGAPEVEMTIDRPEAVRWVDGGLTVVAPTLIATGRPPQTIIDACRNSGEISIEAWISPGNTSQSGPARILTLSADTGQRNVTLGQEGDRYIVRLRTTQTSENGTPRIETPPGTVVENQLTHVVYTRARDGTARIYIDGTPSASGTVAGNLSNWDPGHRLALANEVTGDRPWVGELRTAALYSRALTASEVRRNWQARPGAAPVVRAPIGDASPGRTATETERDEAGPAAGSGRTWQDGFDDGGLEAGWQWRTPVPGPTLSLTDRPGCLRIRLPERPSGFNHWNEPKPVDEAPQLRTPVPEGDWVLETRVRLQQVVAANAFHVGLVAGVSDDFLLSFGPFQAPELTGGAKTPEVCFEPTGSSGFCRVPGDARDVRLRLQLKGGMLRARLSRDGKEWVEAGGYLVPAAPRFVGLIAKTFSAGPAVVFDVDHVRLTPLPGPGPAAPRTVVGIGGDYPTGYRGLLARNGLPYEVLLDYQLADANVLRRFDLLLIGSLNGGIAGRAREALIQVVREGCTALLDGTASPPASVLAGTGKRVDAKGVPDIVVSGTYNPLTPLLGKTTRFAAGESRFHYEPSSFAGLQVLARYDGQPGGKAKPAPAAGYTGTPAVWAMPLGRGLLVYSAPSLGATLSWGPTHDQLADALIQRLAGGRLTPQLVPEGTRLGRKQSGPEQAEKPVAADAAEPPAFERVQLSSPAGGLPRGASQIRGKTAPEFNLSGTYRRERGRARLLLNHWSRRFRVDVSFDDDAVRLTRTEDGKVTDTAETALDERAELPFVVKERRDRVVFLAGARQAVLRGDGLWEGGLASSGDAVDGLRYQPVGPAFLSDDFMRGKDEQGAWKIAAGTWSVRATGDPKMGANPFTYRGKQPKGVGLSVTGFPFWDDYVFEVSAKPTSGGGATGVAFHWHDAQNHMLLRLPVVDTPSAGKDAVEIVRVAGGKETVLTRADGGLVKEQWYRLAVRVRDGLVTASVDGREVAEAEDDAFHAGKIALYVRDAETEFDDVAVRPSPDVDGPVSTELDGTVPRFAGTLDRDTWAGTALQWRADPLVPGLFRRRGRFYGDFALSFRCVFGDDTDAAPAMALLLIPESGGVDSGYGIVLRSTPPGKAAADADGKREYEAELTWRGASLGRCTVASTTEPVLELQRSGTRLLALVDAREVLGGQMTSPPDQLSQLAFRATDFRPRISGLRLRASNVLDTCFDHAPTDWWIGSGTWELAIRWPCTPEWSWLAGEGENRGVAALWHKHRFAGDVTLDLHVGPRTVDHGDGRPREICRAFNVVLCGDGRDVKSGYSFVVGAGKDGTGATLTRNGKVVAHEPAYRIFSDGHNQWINVRAERQGGAIRLWVGDQGILSWEDPEPLPGGRLGIWTEDNAIMVPRVTVYHREASASDTVRP